MRRSRMRFALLLFLFAVATGVEAKQEPAKGTVRFFVEIPAETVRIGRMQIPGTEQQIVSVALDVPEPTFMPAAPGAALLPAVQRFVALPEGASISGVASYPLSSVEIDGVHLLEWAQPARPGQKQREPVPPEFYSIGQEPLFFPAGSALPPPSDLMKASRWPAETATAIPLAASTLVNMARLEISPFVWKPQTGTLQFHSKIDVEVSWTLDGRQNPQGPKPVLADVVIAESLRPLVVNPELIPGLVLPEPRVNDAPYLIITDNFKWNADGTRGEALSGDMVAAFEALANWKREKGIRVGIVTISEIVDRRYGDFSAGAADLPEIIRNFLKFARSHLQTTWVLLGGSDEIIPPRYVLSNAWVNAAHAITGVADEKPPGGRFYYDSGSGTVRMHAEAIRDNPAIRILSTRDSTIFTFVGAPRAARPGWGYVTDDTYEHPSFLPTEWVVLRGPRSAIEGTDFYLDLPENTIPTDLYYASVDDPLYGRPGVRDWDANGDGYYGQHFGATSVDGVSFAPDLFVGRAPVGSPEQARAFGSRVIAYEKYTMGSDFADRALLAASNWGSAGLPVQRQTVAAPPRAGGFVPIFIPGGTEVQARFQGAPPSNSWQLVRWSTAGYQIIPFNASATPTSPGFAYYTDQWFTTLSTTEINLGPFGILPFPLPTAFVRVVLPGMPAEFSGTTFFFDDLEPDGALLEKEQVKTILARSAPQVTTVTRLYQDWFDFPGGPDISLRFTPAAVAEAVRQGQNLISLSGHGSPQGCCGLSTFNIPDGRISGLIYADSCLTNAFDEGVSFSEAMTGGGAGDAVAYIGNTRFSWIGPGAEVERSFWNRFLYTTNLGQLHNDKALLLTSSTKVWIHYALNLLGDPEMSLWRARPAQLFLTVEPGHDVVPGTRLRARLVGADATPLFATRVAMTGDGVFQTGLTDADGWVEFGPLTMARGTVRITAAPSGYAPQTAIVRVAPAGE
jgi:hypothetical protein